MGVEFVAKILLNGYGGKAVVLSSATWCLCAVHVPLAHWRDGEERRARRRARDSDGFERDSLVGGSSNRFRSLENDAMGLDLT